MRIGRMGRSCRTKQVPKLDVARAKKSNKYYIIHITVSFDYIHTVNYIQ